MLWESEEKYRNVIDQSQDTIDLLHNGAYEIMNRRCKEHGATIAIELPVAHMETSHVLGTSHSEKGVRAIGKRRVLIVDDEVSVVELVKAALECEGYDIQTASEGQTALRKIEKNSFDVVISDLKMPGQNGRDMYLYCQEKQPELAERFLFLTGDMLSLDFQEFMEEYEVLFLPKPFDIKILVASVEELIRDD